MTVRWAALLRGVNVGGRHRAPMADVRRIVSGLGLTRPETWLQSGNVFFDAEEQPEEPLAGRLSAALGSGLGFPVPVVLRRHSELAAAVRDDPFGDPDQSWVAFLSHRPEAAAVAALDPGRSPPDRVVVVGRDAHLHCPNGAARTKLTVDWLEAKLGVRATARNHRTLAELVRATAPRGP